MVLPKVHLQEKKKKKNVGVTMAEEARGMLPQEGLISPESTLCGCGGCPSSCILEAPVGEDALGKLFLGPLETGSCTPIQGMHLRNRSGAGEEKSACSCGLAVHTSLASLPFPWPCR